MYAAHCSRQSNIGRVAPKLMLPGKRFFQLPGLAQRVKLLHAGEIVVPLAGLLAEPLRRDVPHGAGHVGMVIALIAAPVGKMDGDIGDHALGRRKPPRTNWRTSSRRSRWCQLMGQRQHEFAGDLGVLARCWRVRHWPRAAGGRKPSPERGGAP